MAALARLLERARALGSSEPEHYVFAACEERIIDPSRPRRAGARRCGNWSARPPGVSAERPHKTRSNPAKVSAARSQPGSEPPPRSAAFDSTTSATRPYRNGRSRRFRCHADSRHRPHVAPDAGALQPRTHGLQTLGAGKTGKRSDGSALGNESARVKESELRPYVTTPRHNHSLQLCTLFVSARNEWWARQDSNL
jgi:hypothetical protein